VNASTLTEDEIVSLQDIFQESYNTLSFKNCDNLFRTVTAVQLRIGPTGSTYPNRQLQETSGSETFGNATESAIQSTSFEVIGSCRGCAGGTFELFDDSFRRRLKTGASQHYDSQMTLQAYKRQMRESDAVCVCPEGVQPGDGQGVTAAEFASVFYSLVDLAVANGQISSIAVARGNVIREGQFSSQPVDCSSDVQQFRSDVSTGLTVDVSTLTEEEIVALQGIFQDCYNGLAFSNCDNLFRTVAAVQLKIVPSIYPNCRLQETFGDTAESAVQATVFEVTGDCRDCPVTPSGTLNLIDDSFRRRLKTGASPHYDSQMAMPAFNRQMQASDDGCFCPEDVQPGDDQGVTTEEFETICFAAVDQAVASGQASSVVSSGSRVIEGQQVPCGQTVEMFQSVWVTDFGTDVRALSLEDQELLKDTVQQSYNDASFSVCDGDFRLVTEVVFLDNGGRRLQEGDLFTAGMCCKPMLC